MKFLSKDKHYHGRVLILRKELEKWLQYTISMFPHYTSHTRDHSEQIILQLSKILFRKGKPTIGLSYAEAYILICSAYFHDAGMVVTPREAEAILASEGWRRFTTGEGKGAERWREIQEIKASQQEPGSSDITAYRADLQRRLLLAEFVRRGHHLRARLALQLHPALRQLVDFNDRRYFEVISTIAEGHGLNRSELNDSARFKEVADLGGEQVNVQFLARLLRIGDLLDLRAARADPYACAATNPLPQDSEPHWKQYSAIAHERVDSLRIEYECECKDQDTHAILRDWFGWLVDEVREAGLAMLHAERHSEWRPPVCTLDDEWTPSSRNRKRQPTIVIVPAEGSKYKFYRWKLEFDQEKVLERLIYNVYSSPQAFIRELIQNALDATRCQMYEDFPARYPGSPAPSYPTQFPEEFLKEYPLKIALSVETEPAEGTDKKPLRQVFTIEDLGTGMDSVTIRRYFLQIGRSFYQSEEFRSRYKFTPTSRFGVGFLSVFGVSSLVTVETSKYPLSTHEPYGLRLVLRGPKNYLLTEQCDPFVTRPSFRRHGTRIRVVLDKPLELGQLTQFIRDWCRRVEVPIEVTEFNSSTTVVAEKIEDRSKSVPSALDPQALFELRSFPISEPGLEGEVYRLAYIDERGESWLREWSRATDVAENLIEPVPKLPSGYTAFHGIVIDKYNSLDMQYGREDSWAFAIDDRRPSAQTTLARTSIIQSDESHLSRVSVEASKVNNAVDLRSVVRRVIQVVVANHLNAEPRALRGDSWWYAGQLLSNSNVDPEFAWSWPKTTPIRTNGSVELLSASEVARLPSLTVLLKETVYRHKNESQPPLINGNVPTVQYQQMPKFLQKWAIELMNRGGIKGVQIFGNEKGDRWVSIALDLAVERKVIKGGVVLGFQEDDVFLLKIDDWEDGVNIINLRHPMVQWGLAVADAAESPSSVISSSMASSVLGKLFKLPGSDEFEEFLSKWRQHPGIPAELMPPQGWGWHKLYLQTIGME